MTDSLRGLILCLCACVAMSVAAQDTIRVVADEYAGTHPDTIRLQDMSSAVDMDEWLLNQVAAQGRQLHENSQALQDSLEYIQDSIYVDSIRHLQEQMPIEYIGPKMVVLMGDTIRSLVRDAEEDRLDRIRAMKLTKTRWRKEATLMAQITQNYVSGNWYQGGNSSFAMLAIAKGQIGYYGDKLTWENTGELREGHSTVHGDSLRKINTTDDLLKLYSKLGYRVYDKLYGSFSAEYEMHFSPIYKANTNQRKSGFASPMRLNLALGLDYKPVKNLSIVVSPLAYKLIYVHDTIHINQNDYGVSSGQKALNDVGSSLRVEYVWKPVREVALETKFYMYTNYKRVELDLEINCDFIINRFFSARLMLHPRYDNSAIMKGDERAKPQFKELLSIGFAHKFR